MLKESSINFAKCHTRINRNSRTWSRVRYLGSDATDPSSDKFIRVVMSYYQTKILDNIFINTYTVYGICPICQGIGKSGRWISLEELARLLPKAECQHEHTTISILFP